MREFDEGYYELHGSGQEFTERPVVLLATERSGSNLLRSIIDAHSDATAPHPLETAYPWRNIESPGDLSPADRRAVLRDTLINKQFSHHPNVAPLDVTSLHERLESVTHKSFLTVQELLYSEYARTVGASTWVTKDPSVWGYLDELREYYDGLRVVYLVRDARDVALSFRTSNVGQSHPYFSAVRWREEQADGRDLLDSAFGDNVHLIRYRDLLREPERIVASLCSFLDLEYEPEMLYFYESENARDAADSAQAFENLSVPIKSDNFGKFRDRLSRPEIALVEKVAGTQLESFGFDLVTDERERDGIDVDPDRFRRLDRKRRRRSALSFWLDNPEEQLHRFASASFKRYMILRYGLLA